MKFYSNKYKKIKSVSDLEVGDMILFSYDGSKLPPLLLSRRMNQEWIIISFAEKNKLILRRKNGKQTLNLPISKVLAGNLSLQFNKYNLVFNLYIKKRISFFEFLKFNLLNLKCLK